MIPLIMAGGGGTRLWPLSREKFPKQFQRLTGNKSLLQVTAERLSALPNVEGANLFVSTATHFAPLVRDQLSVADDRLILEPCKRDNAAAILLSVLKIRQSLGRDDVVVGMFASDHMITDTDLFARGAAAAERVAMVHPGAIVQMGLRPTYAETGYGYIEMGDKESHDDEAGLDVYRVAGFREKPDEETAKKYVASFRYLWNAGIFFFRIDTILGLYERHLPELFASLSALPFGTAEEPPALEKVYPTVQATSIDYGIVEKTKDIFVLPMDHLGWSDVGHFKSLWEVLPKDADGNVLEGSNVLTRDTKNSIVYGNGRLIACIGLENVVVVDTGDMLLVTTKEASQDIKKFLGSDGMKDRKEYL